MLQRLEQDASLSEVHETVDTTQTHLLPWWRRMFSFFGPAYLVSVGYMDPGNWATDLAGGSRFGYTLIWVLLMSNIMAILLQNLSARLGIVRGRDLAQLNRETFPRTINFILYVLAEVAIAACDLAEVLGMAIGIHLLTGLPLVWGVAITVLDTFLLLFLQKLGMRKMEAFIFGLVLIVGFSFLIEILLAKPNLREVASGFVPHIPNDTALYIAIGIIGATVMPHNLYLHSALVQTRKIKKDRKGILQAIRMNFADSAIALNAAFFVNAAILVLAATVFFKSGRTEVAQIKEAHQLLAPLLGTSLAPKLFAIALIAAGQSSTITGTLAGQIVMEGYLRLRINPWARRLLTRLLAILPAMITIIWYGDDKVDDLLVFSQVILSLQLGFAIIPLIHFVSDKVEMGSFVINKYVKAAAWIVASILIYLNIRMVVGQSMDYFGTGGHIIVKILIVMAGIFFLGLLGYITFFPWLFKPKQVSALSVHPGKAEALQIDIPTFRKIAIALDFSEHDEKLLSFALGQGKTESNYLLIHVVESVPATLLGPASDDFETRNDQQTLNFYRDELAKRGYRSEAELGYRDRAKEIVRIVKEQRADMLVIGAHGHTALKDLLYGETINTVRHELMIPVLIVHL